MRNPMMLLATLLAAAAPYPAAGAWICHPRLAEAGCVTDQSTTEVRADGTLRAVPWRAAARPAVDCFYVYPTVSRQPAVNSDLTVTDAERRSFAAQAARYRQTCRMFAPMYRQVTLAGLTERLRGGPGGDEALAYADVKAAWRQYLRDDNGGRGVLLIGHSQGARWLARLIAEEVDGTPAQRLLVAAHLVGHPLPVRAAGGAIGSVPLCHQRDQAGCVIAFSAFRAEAPPPAGSRFARVEGAGQQAACVNPAAPAGGSAPVAAIMPTRGMALASGAPPRPWLTAGETIATAFVVTPGLLSAACVAQDGAQFLAITVHADPADPRTDAIDGDVAFRGRMLPDWGLHAVEMSLTLGSLLDLAGAQTHAWQRRAPAITSGTRHNAGFPRSAR